MYFSPDFISLGARDLPLSLAQLQPETRPNSLHPCLKKNFFLITTLIHIVEKIWEIQKSTEKHRQKIIPLILMPTDDHYSRFAVLYFFPDFSMWIFSKCGTVLDALISKSVLFH